MEKFLLEMLAESSELLLKMQGEATVSKKNWHDLVTGADFASQKLIVSKILGKFPGHTIFAEEGMDKADLYADDCWVIDPLDGTNNYAYGLPLWGVSIAYAKKGELQAGGIAFPNQGIFLVAQKGMGAFEYRFEDGKLGEKKRMRVSKRGEINEAMGLICHDPHGSNADKNLEAYSRMGKKVFNVRNLGAAVYNIGYVALGLTDICVEFRMAPHDGAAGTLLVREAGGRVTEINGEEWKLESPNMVATNSILHEKILEILKEK
ncbi:MAG: inositol monophosphatase family protein [Candidatus Micrarchaeota archaeon]